MSLLTRDYDYELPDELIARWPLTRRDDARMMLLNRDEQKIAHKSFADFSSHIRDGDLVVLNDTKVIPARVFSDDGKIELLFLESQSDATPIWKCLVKPGKKMRIGDHIRVGGIGGEVREILPVGERIIAFDAAIDFEKIGHLPLPPYMRREAEAGDN